MTRFNALLIAIVTKQYFDKTQFPQVESGCVHTLSVLLTILAGDLYRKGEVCLGLESFKKSIIMRKSYFPAARGEN